MPLPNDSHWMPGVSALWSGQREALNQDEQTQQNQRLSQLIQDLQQKRQFEAQMQPGLLEHQSLQNQGLQAGLPGIGADSGQKILNLNEANQTSGGRVDSSNSGSDFKLTEDKAKTMQKLGQDFSTAGMESADLPAVARSGYIMNKLRQTYPNIDGPQGEALRQRLQSVPAEKLPQAIQAMGQALLKQSEPYLQATDTANINKQAQERIAAGNNATTLRAEQMRIDAGKYEKKQGAQDFEGRVQAELLKTAGNVEGQYAVLTRAASVATQMQMPEQAMRYQAQADSIEKAVKAHIDRNKPPGIDLPGVTNLPSAPSMDIRNPSAGGAQPGGKLKSGMPYKVITNNSSLVNK